MAFTLDDDDDTVSRQISAHASRMGPPTPTDRNKWYMMEASCVVQVRAQRAVDPMPRLALVTAGGRPALGPAGKRMKDYHLWLHLASFT